MSLLIPIFSAAQVFLRWLLELGLLSKASIVSFTTVAFLTYVRKKSYPNIKYKTFEVSEDGQARVRVVIRNLESLSPHGVLSLSVSLLNNVASQTKILAVVPYAGEWLYIGGKDDWIARIVGAGHDANALILRFDGLPADDAVMFDLLLTARIPHDDVRVALHDEARADAMPVERFGRLEAFGPLRAGWYYAPRLVFAAALYLVLFSLFITHFGQDTEPSIIDAAVFVGGETLVFLSWLVATPTGGKQTVCGYAAGAVRKVPDIPLLA